MMKIEFWRLWNAVFYAPEDGSGGSGDGTGDGTGGGNGNGNGSGGNDDAAPWYAKAGFSEPNQDHIKTKGWENADALLDSNRQLEKLVGRERLPMPTGKDDTESIDKIAKALGMPDTSESYQAPEGLGEAFKPEALKHFQGVFHNLKLADWQAQGLLKSVHDFTQESVTAKQAQTQEQIDTDKTALEKEWGSKAEANEDTASRAYRSLGISDEDAEKIEDALGYGKFMRLFHNIGSHMSEDTLRQSGNRGQHGRENSFSQSKASAQAQIDKLLGDNEFMSRYRSSNQKVREPAIAEMEKWQKIRREAAA